VLVVWVGDFDGTPNNAFVGLEAATPLLFQTLDALRTERQHMRPPIGYTPRQARAGIWILALQSRPGVRSGRNPPVHAA